MNKYFFFILTAVFVFSGCKESKKTDYTKPSDAKTAEAATAMHPGKKLMETECNICHSPIASEESRIAPPMIAIKNHYITDGTTKEQFQSDLIRWINDPSEEISKMPGALKKFGIMPLQPYPEDKIKLLADYLYDNEIEEPDWFEDHYQQEHGRRQGKGQGKGKQKRKGLGKKNRQQNSKEIGLEYALSTKAQLGKNLMEAIKEKGPVGAVEFCNIEAMKLTDSMSVMHNAIIKRVTDKPRNPDNVANTKELGHIASFKKLVAAGAAIEPVVERLNGEVNFYYPITTNTMCLQCHGTPNEQITPATLTTLRELYPKDEAIGYDTDQVRGIWSINFASDPRSGY